MKEILKLDHIQKYYGNGGNVTKAIQDISFSVQEGEFVGIMGASGSGKTTLLNCISTIDTVSAGHIYLDGTDVTEINEKQIARFRRENLGFVFQNFNLFNNMTVLKNCTVGQEKVLKKSKEEAHKNAMMYLEKVGMAPYINAKPKQLSGGQKQRVAIARALAMNPKMLFFDEPTSALDPEITAGILKVLRELAQEKMTMVIVTHEIAFARKVADRVIFMDSGVIVEQGKPEDVIDNPDNERTKAFLQKLS